MHNTLGSADFDMWIRVELFCDHTRLTHTPQMDCSVTSAQCLQCSWVEICNYHHHSTRPLFGTHNTTENPMVYTYSQLTTHYSNVWIFVYASYDVLTQGRMHCCPSVLFVCLWHKHPSSPLNHQSSVLLLRLWLKGFTHVSLHAC